MLCTDLILPVMIVVGGITLTLGFSAENRHENYTDKYLEPIIIKVNNVIAKLYENEKELEIFYPRFGRLTLSKKEKPSHFGSLNYRKPKGKISEFRRDIRKISKKLKCLIFLEKSPHFKQYHNEEGRVKFLKELLAEINNLLVELSYGKKVRNKKSKKSLNCRMPKKLASRNLLHIKSLTELKIEEWKLLKTLKRILVTWSKNFQISEHGRVVHVECVSRHMQWHSKRPLNFL